MGFFDFISEGIKEHFNKRKQEREMVERMQKEAQIQQAIIFQEEYRKNALEVAEVRAKAQAEKLTGIHKLRATNKALRMGEGEDPNKSDFFKKFSEYTQKNIAKREANLKRTAKMRETAKKMREDTMANKIAERNQRMPRAKPFTIKHGKTK